MSAATSPSTQRPYGVQRVCRIWALPRSTFYQARRPADAAPAKPRGPRPPVDDASLLAAIQADLAASPFSGEGHRKVGAAAPCRIAHLEGARAPADGRERPRGGDPGGPPPAARAATAARSPPRPSTRCGEPT